jgi:hypothetical protein
MKKTCTLVVAVMAGFLSVCGQTVLNQWNTSPNIGNTYLYVRTNYIAPGPDGSGANHAISAAVGFDSLEFTIGDPQHSSVKDSFPGATHTIHSAQDDFFTFVKVNGHGLENLGEHFVSPVGIYPKDNPKTILPFPMQLGTSVSDSFSSVAHYVGFTIYNSGHTVFEGTGDGHLTTPFGTYNVVKVHLVETSVDSIVDTTGTFYSTIITTKDLYYQPGNPLPIAESVIKDFVFFQDSFSLILVEQVVASPDPAAFSFSISPNPTQDIVHLRFEQASGNWIRCTLMDVEGRPLVNAEKRMDVSGQMEISLAELPDGVYFLKVESKDRREIRKVIKSH